MRSFGSGEIFLNFFGNKIHLLLLQTTNLSDGVTGNTSDFGSEESRFET